MLKIKKEFMNVVKNVKNWEEAIEIAAEPLLKNNYIKSEYIKAMIENVYKNGPYIIIIPGFAMPHASSESGVLKTGISLLKLEEAVEFPGQNQIKLMIALASTDPDTHMDIIMDLTDILDNDELMEQLFNCNDIEKIMELLKWEN